jgi:hypothetical protein
MRHFYLILTVVLLVNTGKAQTLGLKLNPAIDMLQGAPKPYFGISCGVYYDQKIYKFFGISTGVEYTQIRVPAYTSVFLLQDFDNYLYHQHQQQLTNLIETPLDITLKMNENKEAKCLVYLTLGYAFGEVFEQRTTYTDNHKLYVSGQINLPSKYAIANSVRLGLEARYNPKPKLNLAFGVQYKYAVLPESYSGEEFNIASVYVKTGLNFIRKTKAKKS